jgi:hypothetical protein
MYEKLYSEILEQKDHTGELDAGGSVNIKT